MEEGGWRLRGYSPFFMLLAHCVRCNEAATRAVSVRIGYLVSYLGPQCHQSSRRAPHKLLSYSIDN